MIISDFFLQERMSATITSEIDDPLIIESQLDDNGIYPSMEWNISKIDGDDVYAFITNRQSDLLSIDPAKCILLSGQTSIVNIGRSRYLALFVSGDSSTPAAQINLLGIR